MVKSKVIFILCPWYEGYVQYLTNLIVVIAKKISTIVLQLPEEFCKLFIQYSLGNFTLSQVETLIYEIVKSESWVRINRPIIELFRKLISIKPDIDIKCILPIELFRDVYSKTMRMIAEIIKLVVLEKFNLTYWFEILSDYVEQVNQNVSRILNAISFSDNVNLIVLDNLCTLLKLKQELSDFSIDIISIGFKPLPIDAMCVLKVLGVAISNDMIELMARSHSEFIRNFVVHSNKLDEAYFKYIHSSEYSKLYQKLLPIFKKFNIEKFLN